MRRHAPAIYGVAAWVLIASFSLIRPFLVRQLPITQELSPKEFGAVFFLAFAVIILEAVLLVRLRRIALCVGFIICASWTLLILIRIALAIHYSPQIFAPRTTGIKVYALPVTAVAVNLAVLRYLRRVML